MSDLIDDQSRAAPHVRALELPLADFVRRAHEEGIDLLREQAASAGLNADDLDELLTYCAEQRCLAAGATCDGCQLRAQARGFTDIDSFVAAHGEIVFRDCNHRLFGVGDLKSSFANLEEMVATWSGEAYWFWARRVLRKLRYGVRKADALRKADKLESISQGDFDSQGPTVILMAPQIPDNIGMAARAMGNFGLDDMRVVEPRDGWPSEKARATASGAAAIIDAASLHGDLGSAIGDLNFVAATTARQRDMRKPVMTPQELAQEIAKRTVAGEKCGVLFGRERNGLSSDEVAVCDAVVMIPVKSDFASLNLAQAVLLIGYEWLKQTDAATLGRVTTFEKPLASGIHLGKDVPATKKDMIGLFEHIEEELERLGFFEPDRGRDIVVRNVRNMLGRTGATAQEVRTFRGIVATLANGKGKQRKAP